MIITTYEWKGEQCPNGELSQGPEEHVTETEVRGRQSSDPAPGPQGSVIHVCWLPAFWALKGLHPPVGYVRPGRRKGCKRGWLTPQSHSSGPEGTHVSTRTQCREARVVHQNRRDWILIPTLTLCPFFLWILTKVGVWGKWTKPLVSQAYIQVGEQTKSKWEKYQLGEK